MFSLIKKIFSPLFILTLIALPTVSAHALVARPYYPPEPIIFTETDLENFLATNRNPQDQTFYLQINKDIPAYTIRVVSAPSSTPGSGFLEIARGINTKPMQKITLNSTSWPDYGIWRSYEIPHIFVAHDINFDGYLDIGIAADGGAKWASYQYWIFNPKTGKFTTSALTKDFRKILFNDVKFNADNKQIVTNNFYGPAISDKTVYQVIGGRLKILEEYHQEQATEDYLPIEKCTITVKKYVNGKVKTTNEVINKECPGYYNNL